MQGNDTKAIFLEAFNRTISKMGVEALKKTTLFGRNDKEEYSEKEAA